MKFQIKLQPETTVTASIEYDFQGWGTIKDHKNNILNQFATQQQNVDIKLIDNYCLSPAHKQLPFDESKSMLSQLSLCEKPEIILTIHPSVRALQLIQQLKDNDKVKERVFHLRKYLEVCLTHNPSIFISFYILNHRNFLYFSTYFKKSKKILKKT